jgi:hypothetical protein
MDGITFARIHPVHSDGRRPHTGPHQARPYVLPATAERARHEVERSALPVRLAIVYRLTLSPSLTQILCRWHSVGSHSMQSIATGDLVVAAAVSGAMVGQNVVLSRSRRGLAKRERGRNRDRHQRHRFHRDFLHWTRIQGASLGFFLNSRPRNRFHGKAAQLDLVVRPLAAYDSA